MKNLEFLQHLYKNSRFLSDGQSAGTIVSSSTIMQPAINNPPIFQNVNSNWGLYYNHMNENAIYERKILGNITNFHNFSQIPCDKNKDICRNRTNTLIDGFNMNGKKQCSPSKLTSSCKGKRFKMDTAKENSHHQNRGQDLQYRNGFVHNPMFSYCSTNAIQPTFMNSKNHKPLIPYDPPTYDFGTEPIISGSLPFNYNNSHVMNSSRTYDLNNNYLDNSRGSSSPDSTTRESSDETTTSESSESFLCLDCGQRFNRKANLKRHRLIHTGERPFVCNYCGDTFTQIANLNYHQRIHKNELPYGCNICNKNFRSSSHLKRHLRIHSGEKPYVCSTCSASFRSWDQKKRHVFAKHQENINNL